MEDIGVVDSAALAKPKKRKRDRTDEPAVDEAAVAGTAADAVTEEERAAAKALRKEQKKKRKLLEAEAAVGAATDADTKSATKTETETKSAAASKPPKSVEPVAGAGASRAADTKPQTKAAPTSAVSGGTSKPPLRPPPPPQQAQNKRFESNRFADRGNNKNGAGGGGGGGGSGGGDNFVIDSAGEESVAIAIREFKRNAKSAKRSAQAVLKKAKRQRNIMFYNKLISQFANEKQLGFALRAYADAVEILKLQPTVYTFTNLINACVRCGDTARAEAVLRAMATPRFGRLQPNIVTHTAYIKGLCSDDDPKAVHKAYACLLQIIKQQNDTTASAAAAAQKPTTGYGGGNRFNNAGGRGSGGGGGEDESGAWSEEANTTANIRTFNTLLRGCLRCGEVDLAVKIFELLRNGGRTGTTSAGSGNGSGSVQPDVSSYEYMIKVLCCHNRLREAWTISEEMESYATRLVSQYQDAAHANDPNYRPHNTQLRAKLYVSAVHGVGVCHLIWSLNRLSMRDVRRLESVGVLGSLQKAKPIHPAHAPSYAALATASAVYGDFDSARRALSNVDSALASADTPAPAAVKPTTGAGAAGASGAAGARTNNTGTALPGTSVALSASTSPAYSGIGTDSKSHALFMKLRRAEVTREVTRVREFLALNPQPNAILNSLKATAAATGGGSGNGSGSGEAARNFRDSKRVRFFERIPIAPVDLSPDDGADDGDGDGDGGDKKSDAKDKPKPAKPVAKKATFTAADTASAAALTAGPVEVLDLARLFGNTKPIRMEICAGSGDWIVARAKAAAEAGATATAATGIKKSSARGSGGGGGGGNSSDDCNWIAVEQRVERCYHIWCAAAFVGPAVLERLAICCSEANSLVSRAMPAGSISEVFINYPDPPVWLGSKQRLIDSAFLKNCHIALRNSADAAVTLVTDDAPYALSVVKEFEKIGTDWFVSAFTNADGTAQPFTTAAPAGYGTSFFDRLWKNGQRTSRYWLKYLKRTASSAAGAAAGAAKPEAAKKQ